MIALTPFWLSSSRGCCGGRLLHCRLVVTFGRPGFFVKGSGIGWRTMRKCTIRRLSLIATWNVLCFSFIPYVVSCARPPCRRSICLPCLNIFVRALPAKWRSVVAALARAIHGGIRASHYLFVSMVVPICDEFRMWETRNGPRLPRMFLENLQHMWWAIQQYPHPHHISFDRADDGRVVNVSQRPADADASMDVETGSAASSTTRRPKAKARPRQPTVLTDVMLIRYDNPRNLAMDVARRRGKFLACGVDIAESGLASQDAVGKLIEEPADIRDRQLPQRGDLPKFATDVWMWKLGAMSMRGTHALPTM